MSKTVRALCSALLLTNAVFISPANNAYAIEIKKVSEGNVLNESIKTLKYGQVVNVGDLNLRIRKSPNLEAEIEYGMFNGMTFSILGRVGDWYKITHYKTTGYVHKDYVVEYNDVPPYETYDASKARENEDITEEFENSYNRAKVIETESLSKEIKVELTAYCNCSICTGQELGITAMGTTTRVGVVAVPQNIPLGSKLYIPDLTYYKSDGVFHAEDRGGAIQMKDDGTYIVDIWMPSHEQALQFGRQTMTAYIID